MKSIALAAIVLTACTPAAQTALEVLAPVAVDALTQLVAERWGSNAEVDTETAGCFRAPASVAVLVGDDDLEFVYAVCRAKALEGTP